MCSLEYNKMLNSNDIIDEDIVIDENDDTDIKIKNLETELETNKQQYEEKIKQIKKGHLINVKKLKLKIDKLEKRIAILEKYKTDNENKKKERQKQLILSDFYREENTRISMILREEKFNEYDITEVNDLNKLIGTYITYEDWKEHSNSPLNIKQFKNVFLPNLNKWFPNWNWDYYIYLHSINSIRNSEFHFFNYKDDKKTKILKFESFVKALQRPNINIKYKDLIIANVLERLNVKDINDITRDEYKDIITF